MQHNRKPPSHARHCLDYIPRTCQLSQWLNILGGAGTGLLFNSSTTENVDTTTEIKERLYTGCPASCHHQKLSSIDLYVVTYLPMSDQQTAACGSEDCIVSPDREKPQHNEEHYTAFTSNQISLGHCNNCGVTSAEIHSCTFSQSVRCCKIQTKQGAQFSQTAAT